MPVNFAARRATVALMVLCPAAALASPPLALFGTPVKGARRAVLQQTLSKAGLTPVRVNNSYFCDKYDTNGRPQGASKLIVCYTGRSNAFAIAQYTFPTFMNTRLVQRVIDMVRHQYGPPTGVRGSYGLGPVRAWWELPGGTRIEVIRGWPNVTTYLRLVDVATNRRLDRQLNAARHARQSKREKADAGSF